MSESEMSGKEKDIYESRLKIFYLPERFLLEVLRSGRWEPRQSHVMVTVGSGFPQGSIIRACYYKEERRGFAILVWNLEFDPVLEGALVPEWEPFISLYQKCLTVVDPDEIEKASELEEECL